MGRFLLQEILKHGSCFYKKKKKKILKHGSNFSDWTQILRFSHDKNPENRKIYERLTYFKKKKKQNKTKQNKTNKQKTLTMVPFSAKVALKDG